MGLSNTRISAATSSTIASITANGTAKGSIGAPFFTYLEECRYELGLLQNLEGEVEVIATEWGKVVESFVHKKLPKNYKFHSDKTKAHPKHPRWVGTPDGSDVKKVLDQWIDEAITDIKCPLTKKSFCQLVSGLYEIIPTGGVKRFIDPDMNKVVEMLRKKAKDGNKFYWQLVSNSCIFNTKYAELIVFMPFYETLQEILKYNDSLDIENDKNRNNGKPKQSYLVTMAGLTEKRLPYLLKESGYQEVNKIRFEVPLEDKIFLEKRFRILDAAIGLSTNDYESFLEQGKAVSFKEDEVCLILQKFTKELIK